MAGADAAATLRSSVAPANLSLVSALLACAIAQFLKPFTTWYFFSCLSSDLFCFLIPYILIVGIAVSIEWID